MSSRSLALLAIAAQIACYVSAESSALDVVRRAAWIRICSPFLFKICSCSAANQNTNSLSMPKMIGLGHKFVYSSKKNSTVPTSERYMITNMMQSPSRFKQAQIRTTRRQLPTDTTADDEMSNQGNGTSANNAVKATALEMEMATWVGRCDTALNSLNQFAACSGNGE